MMTIHMAILMRPYVDMILQGRKTVESRLTKRPLPPYRCVSPGDRILVKVSSGPVAATAVAGAVEFHEGLTPAKVAALKRRLNGAVCGDEEFWTSKRDSRYATFITLEQVTPIEHGSTAKVSSGMAWFVMDEAALASVMGGSEATNVAPVAGRVFSVELTPGAIRNGYVRVPPSVHRFAREAYGGRTQADAGEPLTLHLPDGAIVTSDIASNHLIRWRGWRSCFDAWGMQVGDRVRFVQIALRRYLVEFVPSSERASLEGGEQTPPPPAANVPP